MSLSARITRVVRFVPFWVGDISSTQPASFAFTLGFTKHVGHVGVVGAARPTTISPASEIGRRIRHLKQTPQPMKQ
jgi:hypothetical protein